MSVKDTFIEKGIRKLKLDEYLQNEFERAGYSHSDIKRTPVGTHITLHADKVGMVIGRGGKTINRVTDKIEEEFDLEDPRVTVEEIDNPFLDSRIVAEEIKNAIENGVHHRKICNIMLSRVMENGAVGCQIRVHGRTGGSQTRHEKFSKGYLKHSGEYAEKMVDTATTEAHTPLSSIGIKVKIMKEKPEADIRQLREALEEGEEEEIEEEELVCPVCGAEYDSPRALNIHIGAKHQDEEATEEVSEEEIEEEPEGIEGSKIAKLIEGNVKEVKKKIKNARNPDYGELLEAEKAGKDRKGVVGYLEKLIEDSEEEAGDE